MTEHKAVASLAEAKVGDLVWFFDSQRPRYSEDGKYEGRGVWKLYRIDAENRASFFVLQTKFDRKTGEERATRGFSASYRIFGERERANRAWRDSRMKIASIVERLDDAEKLKAVAAVIGWSPEDGK